MTCPSWGRDLVTREAPLRVERFIGALLDTIESLETMATRGAVPRDPTLRRRRYRYLVHGHYLVSFKVNGRQVRVYRVIHGSRAYRGLL